MIAGVRVRFIVIAHLSRLLSPGAGGAVIGVSGIAGDNI